MEGMNEFARFAAARRRREAFALAERESRDRRAKRAQAAQRAASVADTERLCHAAAVRIEAPFTAGGELLRAGVL